MHEIFQWFDLLGVMVFAVSGILIAHKKQMDGFGVVVLACVTAIGGGTLRDIILDTPVFWLHDPSYFLAIAIAVILNIILLNRQKAISHNMLQIADAIGLAFFAIMGVQKALALGLPDLTAIIMGVLTGCFGGVIRDVLAQEIPMLLKGELYAITCIFGAIVYTQLIKLNVPTEIVMVSAMCVTLFMRLLAIRYKWGLHVFKY
jgi:uncharacterized membrane protein YeiH